MDATLLSCAPDQFETLDVTVLALLPEFRLVKVAASDGRHFSVTRHTEGVQVSDLRVGQRLSCVVTRKLSRVITASLIG